MKRIPLSSYQSFLVFGEELYICTRTPGSMKNITIANSITNYHVFDQYCENCEVYKPYVTITKELYQSYWNFTILKPSLLKQLSLDIHKVDIKYPHLYYYNKGLITIEQLIACDYIADIINYLFSNHYVKLSDVINKEAPTLKSLRKYCGGIHHEPCNIESVKDYRKRTQKASVSVPSLKWYYSVNNNGYYVSDDYDNVPSFPNVYDDGKICFDGVRFNSPESMIEAFWNSDFNSDLIFDKISCDYYDDYHGTDYRYTDSIPTEDLRDVIINSFDMSNSCVLSDELDGEEEIIPSEVKEVLILNDRESLLVDFDNNYPDYHNGNRYDNVILYILGKNGDDLICDLPDFTEDTSKRCKINLPKLKEHFANA
jgi:hypothetical protein